VVSLVRAMAASILLLSVVLGTTAIHALETNATCQPTGGRCIGGVPCCYGACDVHGRYCEGNSHGGPQCVQPGMWCSGNRAPCCSGASCQNGVCTRWGGGGGSNGGSWGGGGGSSSNSNCSPENDICSIFGVQGKSCCAGLSCEQGSQPTVRICKRADPYSCAGPGQMCQWDGVSVTRSCCGGSSCTLRTKLGRACTIPRSCGNSGDECKWLVSGYNRPCCGGQCILQGLRYKCAWNLQSSADLDINATMNDTLDDAMIDAMQDSMHV